MLIKAQKLYPDAQLPRRASPGAVGFDVYGYHVLDKTTHEVIGNLPYEIFPGGSVIIGIGIKMAIPFPYDCQVRPRSGLASKYDVELSNSPGTIDPDFRGEAGILLRNRGNKSFIVEKGMRIAQLVFEKAEVPHFVESETLPPTPRDVGGFGSTGLSEITLGDTDYLEEQARWDRHFMRLAISAAGLSSCLRGGARKADGSWTKDTEGRYYGATRRFGCVIVKGQNVVAQGFNTRSYECSEEHGCVRERENLVTGVAKDRGCLHAEEVTIQNYGRTGGPALEGSTVYVNAEPCLKCAKLLTGFGISAVVVPHGVYATNGLAIMINAGIEVRHVNV